MKSDVSKVCTGLGKFLTGYVKKGKNEQSSWDFLKKMSFLSLLKYVKIDVNFIVGL